MRKTSKRLAALALVAVLVATLVPATAFAATKKLIVNHARLSYSAADLNKRSKEVTKGTYSITFKKLGYQKGNPMALCGFVRFVAPKTGKYTFTISKATSDDKTVDGASINYWMKNTKGTTILGQKVDYYPTKQVTLRANDSTQAYVAGFPAKTSTKIRLKKGERVYIQVLMAPGITSTNLNKLANGKITLKIK